MTITDRSAERRADAAATDRLYAALSLPVNLEVIEYFRETGDEHASLRAVAEAVVSRRSDESSSDDVAVRLHHVGLPKLDAAGVLEYDPDSCAVHWNHLPAAASASIGDH